MPRSPRQPQAVNFISFEELKEVIGPDFETVIRNGFAEYFARVGRAIAEALIAGEVSSLCGAKHSRKINGNAVRWGSQPGAISVHGVKQPIEKPRVRTADGQHEIDLETYAVFSKKDALRNEAAALVGSGV